MEFFILLIGLIMLISGAEGIVRGSVSLAKQINVSLFAIGVVIVAAGTSLPELANCVQTVIMQHPDIAVGAVVGSNISNIFLIMGTTALLFPVLKVNNDQINQSVINIIISLGFIFFSWMALSFNVFFGIIAIVLLIAIMYYQMRSKSVDLNEVEEQKTYSLVVTILLIILGVFLLIIGSRLFIESAITIAENFNIPESIIGVSLVAFGTSLPELVVGIVSAIKKRVDFALGNVLGSNIYNLLGILGISSFFGTFEIPNLVASYDMYIMIISALLISFFIIFVKKLNRFFGIISILSYFAYIISLYY